MSDSSVLALRFGMSRFPDNNTLSIDFDPATLGFSPTYLEPDRRSQKFPGVRIRGYDQFASQTLGAINPTEVNWKSTSANAQLLEDSSARTCSRSAATSARSASTPTSPGDGAGFFDFDKDMTSSNGGTGSTTDGNAFASFLLGYPSSSRASQPDLGVDAAQPLHPLLRRLRAGRLAGQPEADAELRPAVRARERAARRNRPLHRRLRSGDGQRAVVGHHSRRSARGHAGAQRAPAA